MRNCFSLLAAALAFTAFQAHARAPRVPTFDDIISLKRPGGVALSPDGSTVAFTVNETNWEDNAFETEIFLARTGSQPVQLTRAKKSSMSPSWSPDGKWLAFVSDRTDKRQIYVISPDGGEALPITNVDEGVGSFSWSPDGRSIALTMTEPKSETQKERDKKYGEFVVEDQDYRMTHLHVIDVDPAATATPRRLTSGPFTVGSFDWSPDAKSIAFDHRIDPNLSNSGTADISIVTVTDGSVRKLVAQEGPDSRPVWSPDGSHIVFQSAMRSPWFFYTNSRLAIVPASGGAIRTIADGFDENPNLIDWSAGGVLFSGSEKIVSRLYRADPATGRVTPLSPASGIPAGAFGYSFSRDFTRAAFVSGTAQAFPEIYTSPLNTLASASRLTSFGDQIKDWKVGSREMVSWRSTDGTLIEGVLHKPADFQPGRKYPLLVVIHGGPTGISRPVRVQMGGVYPIEQWLAKGAIVLEPNYRGSAGYGEKFRSLTVRNLGVGDAWDVLSGVDHLVAQGLADKDRLGVMGWSQGGYISAFLATHERQIFKAISVGAGISNWMTYYVNTDIHPFTRQYLKATPWDDPQIYAKTSPMTSIKQAKTPTLIQHGELDARVPPPNAFELYQGLQDVGVPVKLIVYKGFGHGLNKPKAQRAALEHNWEWFEKYVFGAEGAKKTN